MKTTMKLQKHLIPATFLLLLCGCGPGSFDVPPLGTDITPESGLAYDDSKHAYLIPLSDDCPRIRYKNFILTKPANVDFIAKALSNSDRSAEWELRNPPKNSEFFGRVQHFSLNPPLQNLEEIKLFCDNKFRSDKRIISYSSEIEDYGGTPILLMEGSSRESNSGRIVKMNGFIMLDPHLNGAFFNVSSTRIAYENKIDAPELKEAAEAFLHAFEMRTP